MSGRKTASLFRQHGCATDGDGLGRPRLAAGLGFAADLVSTDLLLAMQLRLGDSVTPLPTPLRNWWGRQKLPLR